MSDSSTDDNSKLVDMDDLTAFEDSFYNRKAPKAEPKEEVEEVEEEVENEDGALANEENAEDEGSEEDEEETPKPEEKPKKKPSFQERINELTAKAREAERREAEANRRLADLEARKTEERRTEPTAQAKSPEHAAPSPDAIDEKGESIYPLGEFDPKFIRDLTKFTIAVETKAAKEAAAIEAQQATIKAQQEELTSSWAEKVNEAEKEIPELRENLASMEAAFTGIDPNYGEFLAATIMTCDYGPQIMHYLSQNIGEAQKIVASGPAAATLALGRLDAKFVKSEEPEKRNTKVSAAPAPSENRIRGSAGKFSTPGDTDDLEAFERAFFKKK